MSDMGVVRRFTDWSCLDAEGCCLAGLLLLQHRPAHSSKRTDLGIAKATTTTNVRACTCKIGSAVSSQPYARGQPQPGARPGMVFHYSSICTQARPQRDLYVCPGREQVVRTCWTHMGIVLSVDRWVCTTLAHIRSSQRHFK